MIKLKIIFLNIFVCFSGTSLICQDYEQQVATNPDDYTAVYNAGVVAFKENKLERAQECFNLLKSHDFLKDDKVSLVQGEHVFYNAGNTEVKLKKYEDALASFEKVLTFNAHNELARKKIEHIKVLLEQKKEDQANEQQDKDQQDKQQQDKDTQDKKEQKQEEKKQNDQDKQDNSEQDKSKQEKSDQDKASEDQQEESEQQDEQEENLTEQEKQLLAYVQNQDENMYEQMEKKKLKQAQGAMNVRNNW